jgi:hypothetical protein
MSSKQGYKLQYRLIFGCTPIVASFSAFGQTPPQPTLASLNLSCSDFHDNQNGSWSPTHPISIGGATVGPGASFGPGVIIAAVPLAALLNKECGTH